MRFGGSLLVIALRRNWRSLVCGQDNRIHIARRGKQIARHIETRRGASCIRARREVEVLPIAIERGEARIGRVRGEPGRLARLD